MRTHAQTPLLFNRPMFPELSVSYSMLGQSLKFLGTVAIATSFPTAHSNKEIQKPQNPLQHPIKPKKNLGFYPRDARRVRPSVCLSVRLSHAGIVPSRAKARS